MSDLSRRDDDPDRSLDRADLAPVLDSHRGHETLREVLQHSLQDSARLLSALARYVQFNAAFGAGVSNLAGEIAARPELFRDPDEPVKLLSDRSAEVGSDVFHAAIDEFDDRGTPWRDTHRTLAQAFVKGLAQALGYRLDQIDAVVSASRESSRLRADVSRGYGVGEKLGDDRLFEALGFHAGSEVLADREFNQIDQTLSQGRPDLVKALKATRIEQLGEKHDAWYWVFIHTSVEADHFEAALLAVRKALRYYSGERPAAEMKRAVLRGFQGFATLQQSFLTSLGRAPEAEQPVAAVASGCGAVAPTWPDTFRAVRVFEQDGRPVARLVEMPQDELSPGEVLIEVSHSSLNYKDALAVTGRGRILKRLPLNAGIDAVGVVLSSSDSSLRAGEPVLVNGMGLGESVDGGLARRIRVPADWVVPLPVGLTAWEAMALGTAGFTAALCLHRMQQNGQFPELGPVLVTGASGGVGQIAVDLFSRLGYEVWAVSGRPEHADALRALGASEVRTPEALGLGARPLENGRFGGAVDNVGGELLSGLLRHVRPWGNVAVVGNASGAGFQATVFPLILRGVSLLGISSTNCSMSLRRELWARLGSDWKPEVLSQIVTRTLPLSEVGRACEELVDRKSHGRTVVDCSLV